MTNLFSIKDKVIVLTGGTGVLGTSKVHYFADQGAKVVVLARNEAKGKVLQDAECANGYMMDKEALAQCYTDITARYGRIDVLINGAGSNTSGATISPDKSIVDLEVDTFKKVVDLKLLRM